jgi:hypothetical protein
MNVRIFRCLNILFKYCSRSLCLFIYICYRYMFQPLLAIFRWNIQLLLEVIAPMMDTLFCVLYLKD